jgi:flagellar biosynthesis/type III secretory pathway ATPase
MGRRATPPAHTAVPKGSDPATDEAIEKNKAINDFLKQKLSEKSTYQDAVEALKKLAGT